MHVSGGLWNHNIHYHPLILDAVPAEARRALDVGCGDGVLTRELRERVPEVVGIDADAPSIERALGHDDDIEYLPADFLHHSFEPASFDLVASVATLHHMPAAAALDRMRDLVRPAEWSRWSGSRVRGCPPTCRASLPPPSPTASTGSPGPTGSLPPRRFGPHRRATAPCGPSRTRSCQAPATAGTCCGATR